MVGGFDKYKLGMKKVIHRLAMRYEQENRESFFASHTFEPTIESGKNGKANIMDKFVAVAVDPVEENLL